MAKETKKSAQTKSKPSGDTFAISILGLLFVIAAMVVLVVGNAQEDGLSSAMAGITMAMLAIGVMLSGFAGIFLRRK
jgi:uncharacterized membrane protein